MKIVGYTIGGAILLAMMCAGSVYYYGVEFEREHPPEYPPSYAPQKKVKKVQFEEDEREDEPILPNDANKEQILETIHMLENLKPIRGDGPDEEKAS